MHNTADWATPFSGPAVLTDAEPPPPKYIVLPTRELVLDFRTKVLISERNMGELIEQIFDRFMQVDIYQPVMLSPIFGMLVKDPLTDEIPKEIFEEAFRELCHGLRTCLCGLGFKGIIRKDNGEFNYKFHSLRASDIVVVHLSSTPEF